MGQISTGQLMMTIYPLGWQSIKSFLFINSVANFVDETLQWGLHNYKYHSTTLTSS